MLGGLALLVMTMAGVISAKRHFASPTEQTLRRVFRQVRDEARQESSPLSISQLWLIGRILRPFFGRGGYGSSDPFRIPNIEETVNALGPEATPLLLKALKRDRSPAVRIFCAKALANRLDSPEVLPAMIAALHAEKNESVRLKIMKSVAQEQEEEVILVLLDAVRADPAADIRAAAAEGLGEWTDKRAFAALASSLSGEVNNVARLAMVTALGQQGDPRAATLLLASLGTDTDDTVRSRAARILPRWDEPGIPEALAKALRDDRSSDVRAEAASNMSQFPPDFFVPRLIAALTDDASAEVRESAAEALGKAGDARAIAPLVDKLAHDPEEDVAAAAATALGRLNDPSAVPALIEALSTNPSESVQQRAAEALGTIGGSTAFTTLSTALTTESRSSVANSLVEALGDMNDPQAVPHLLAFQRRIDTLPENEWKWTKNRVLTALARIGGDEAVEALATALSASGHDPSQRMEIAQGLAMIGTPAAIDVLLKAATSATESIRLAAAAGLCLVGCEDGVTILMKAFDTGSQLKEDHIICLGSAMDPRTIPMLIKLRKDFNDEVAWALGHFDDSRAVPLLIETLRMAREDIRCLAGGFALAEIADPAQADELITLLAKKHDEYSQLAIACALACIDRQEALPILSRQALVTSDWQRLAAAMGLIRLGTPEALDALRPLLRDPNPPLRELARRAMAGEGAVALTAPLLSHDGSYDQYAARCLVFLHDPATLPMLQAAIKDNPDPEVRRYAILAVRRIQKDAAREARQGAPGADPAATAEPQAPNR
jgi:HEAT repeat protein